MGTGLLEDDDMNVALETITRDLNGEIDLDSLEECIIPLAWDDEFEDQDLIDLVSIEIAYISDQVSNESTFRDRISQIAASRESVVVNFSNGIERLRVSNVTDSIADIKSVTYRHPSPVIDYQVVVELS